MEVGVTNKLDGTSAAPSSNTANNQNRLLVQSSLQQQVWRNLINLREQNVFMCFTVDPQLRLVSKIIFERF